MAFALGVTYLLARADPPLAWRVAVPILSIGVGGLRVAAGHHFPTDVVGGAALGAVVAWLVHEVRY
jgi:membrane-associated phospholipid phosphatase